ncbi:MAG: hypothetical protein JRF63_05275 [Deltaproteobacteria bacterium]|nr:hypothetical protein [Deltaproteobacteria bacterium]
MASRLIFGIVLLACVGSVVLAAADARAAEGDGELAATIISLTYPVLLTPALVLDIASLVYLTEETRPEGPQYGVGVGSVLFGSVAIVMGITCGFLVEWEWNTLAVSYMLPLIIGPITVALGIVDLVPFWTRFDVEWTTVSLAPVILRGPRGDAGPGVGLHATF